ncbi:MAG: hypothetical protein HQL66_15640 [Magnetococcales bacterium]|nr:hypothetical protein [Magnetococcales bacterium]
MLYQTGQLSGHLHPMPEDLKEALAKVEDFVRDLKALPEVVEVQTLKMPLNLGQGGVIQGGGGAISGDVNQFVLKVTFAFKP